MEAFPCSSCKVKASQRQDSVKTFQTCVNMDQPLFCHPLWGQWLGSSSSQSDMRTLVCWPRVGQWQNLQPMKSPVHSSRRILSGVPYWWIHIQNVKKILSNSRTRSLPTLSPLLRDQAEILPMTDIQLQKQPQLPWLASLWVMWGATVSWERWETNPWCKERRAGRVSKQWRDRGGAKKSCVKILLLGIVGNWWIGTEDGSGLGVT